MGSIVNLPADRHEETQLLLPWYATGQADDIDRAIVEAHLAECSECRQALDGEAVLKGALAAQSSEAAEGWAALEARLRPAPAPRRSRRRWTAPLRAAARPERLKWVVAAQFAVLAVVGFAALSFAPPSPRPAQYRALGDAAAAHPGNVLAMFQPTTSESDFRRALQSSGARLVDGPTATGAYVLAVPGEARATAIERLRSDQHVTLAEPIDQAAAE